MEKKEKQMSPAPEKKMTFAEVHGALLHVVREYRAFVALEEILRRAETIERDLQDLEKTKEEQEKAHLRRQQELLASEEETQKQIASRLASVKAQAERDMDNIRALVASQQKELQEYQNSAALAKVNLDHSVAQRQRELQELQAMIEKMTREGQLEVRRLEDQKQESVRTHQEQVERQYGELDQISNAIAEARIRLRDLQTHIRGLHSSLGNLAE